MFYNSQTTFLKCLNVRSVIFTVIIAHVFYYILIPNVQGGQRLHVIIPAVSMYVHV